MLLDSPTRSFADGQIGRYLIILNRIISKPELLSFREIVAGSLRGLVLVDEKIIATIADKQSRFFDTFEIE
jgi:hypothetical protein